MKKLIILLILAISLAVETRTFLEQKLNYDRNYYSDMGLDVRFNADNAMFQIKRGIVFSSLKRPFAIGNHEWYYVGYNTRYYTPFGNVYAEILTEVNPFEGNDFSMTKQSSTQSLGYGLAGFDIKRTKITNGDFFSEISYQLELDKTFYKSIFIVTYIGKSLRSSGNLLNFWEDKLFATQYALANWIMIPLDKNLEFAIRGQIFTRVYADNTNDNGYSISIGLIAK